MAAPLVRRLMWPTAAVVAVVAVGGLMLTFKVNVVAGIVTPVVVAFLTGWVVHRFPQLRRPVAVTARLTDVDYLMVGDSRVPASGHTVRITVEATGPLTVVLDRLRPVIVSRVPPRGYLSPRRGVVDMRRFKVLLDDNPPTLRPMVGRDGQAAPDFPFTVSANDPEVFELTAVTEKDDVLWRLELDTVCLGRRRTTRIDLGGQPFRTMARPEWTRAKRQRSDVT